MRSAVDAERAARITTTSAMDVRRCQARPVDAAGVAKDQRQEQHTLDAGEQPAGQDGSPAARRARRP